MPEPEPEPVNPMASLVWLTKQANKQRFGKSNFTDCAETIRSLMRDRAQLTRQVEKLELQIAALQKKAEKQPYDTGGQGQWDEWRDDDINKT